MSTDGEYSLPSPSQLHTACIEGDVKTLELFIHRHSPWLCHQLDRYSYAGGGGDGDRGWRRGQEENKH